MKMSNKQAWDIIKHRNEKFNSPLVTSHRGGKGGGYAVVTENGLNIIGEYKRLQNEFSRFLDQTIVNISK